MRKDANVRQAEERERGGKGVEFMNDTGFGHRKLRGIDSVFALWVCLGPGSR